MEQNLKPLGTLLGRTVYIDINSGKGVHKSQEEWFLKVVQDIYQRMIDLIEDERTNTGE
jgi:hypothetical protein